MSCRRREIQKRNVNGTVVCDRGVVGVGIKWKGIIVRLLEEEAICLCGAEVREEVDLGLGFSRCIKICDKARKNSKNEAINMTAEEGKELFNGVMYSGGKISKNV